MYNVSISIKLSVLYPFNMYTHNLQPRKSDHVHHVLYLGALESFLSILSTRSEVMSKWGDLNTMEYVAPRQ